jgi:trk system potassium uptake protein
MKFCVIGVGRFGYYLATTLADNGMEVLAVDSNESIIASIRDKVTQAICMRVSDEDTLRSIGAEEMDTVIVAMGENFAQSILVTAILKHRLKTPTVITRSISEIHRDILQLIGADQVILPEREVGRRLADTLSLPFAALVRLSRDFCISQLPTPIRFIGQTIKELALPNTYGITCIGRRVNHDIVPLDEDYVIAPDDELVLAGSPRDIAKIAKLPAA